MTDISDKKIWQMIFSKLLDKQEITNKVCDELGWNYKLETEKYRNLIIEKMAIKSCTAIKAAMLICLDRDEDIDRDFLFAACADLTEEAYACDLKTLIVEP